MVGIAWGECYSLQLGGNSREASEIRSNLAGIRARRVRFAPTWRKFARDECYSLHQVTYREMIRLIRYEYLKYVILVNKGCRHIMNEG